jgi:hypothetical protein
MDKIEKIKNFSEKHKIENELSEFLYKVFELLKLKNFDETFGIYKLSEFYEISIEEFWIFVNLMNDKGKNVYDLIQLMKMKHLLKTIGEENLSKLTETQINNSISNDIILISSNYSTTT